MLALLVVGVVLTFGWLSLSTETVDDGSPAVISVTDGKSRDTSLPEFSAASPEGLAIKATGSAVGDADAGDAAIDPAELLRDYPRTTVQGRVVLLDDGEFPDNMTVEASRNTPLPGVRQFSLSMIRDGERSPVFNTISDAALRTRTRVAVGQDGRFEMPDFPLERAVWIDVDHSDWYQSDAQLYENPADGDELLVELSRGASIRGRIVDSDGKPVTGLEVSGGSTIDPYAILDGTSILVKLDDVISDYDGRFVIAPTPVNSPVVLSTSPDFGLQPLVHKVAGLTAGAVAEETLEVQRGCEIRGLVLDVDGQPVAATRVEIQPTTISMADTGLLGQLKFNKNKTTDAQGHFTFDSLADGSYRLNLTQGGYRPVPSETIAVAAGQIVENIVLQADRGLSVSGKVTGPDGEPLVAANVTGFLPPSMFSMRSTADRDFRASEQVDEQGHFTLWGYDEGDVRVLAEAEGFVGRRIDVAAGAGELVLQLQRKTTIDGIAIDLSTGDPLTDYQLRLTSARDAFDMSAIMEMGERIENQRAPMTVSDDEGRFSLDDVTPGVYDLLLVADGHARTTLHGVEVPVGVGAHGVIIMVPEEASVIGQVISGRTGQSLPGVTVTTGKTDAMSTWKQLLTGPVPKTTSDSEGRFELGGLGAEPLTISVQDRDHRSVVLGELVLRPGEIYNVGLVTLPPGGTIQGTVYGPEAQPVAGVAVMAADALGKQMKRATTEVDGSYMITGLESGTYNVMRLDFSLTLDSDNPASMLQDLTFETVKLELDEVKTVDLGAPSESGCLLEGRVQGSGGPEADAMVVVLRESGPPATKFGGTDDDGRYAIKGLQPGKHLVQVMPTGSMVGGGSQPSSPIFSTVMIGDETRHRHDIDVPGAVLRGETRSSSGERLKGIRVLLERVDEDRPQSRFIERMGGRVGEAYSDGQGEFSFEHLPAGSYALQAGGTNIIGLGKAGWAMTRVEDIAVREDSEGFKVVVELESGGGVSGVVLGPDDRPLSGVPVWARSDKTGRWTSILSEITTDAGGHYTVNSLEPGSWTLAFGGDDWALTLVESLHVQRDRVASKDVALEPGVEVFAQLGSYSGQRLSASILGPQGVVPSELTSLTGLMGGETGSAGRQRLGRLPRGTYSVSLIADGKAVFQDTIHLGKGDTEVVVSLDGES